MSTIKSNTIKAKSPHKVYISFLSVLSAFAVVCLHVNTDFWNFSNDSRWLASNIIECVFYFAVPIFFMISGATLIDYRKRYTTKQYFKKRFSRIVIPFLFWSILSGIFVYFRSSGGSHLGVRSIIQGILNTEYNGIFWFFPALFSVYLAFPILSNIDDEKKEELFKYIIIAGVFLNIVFPLCCKLLNIKYSDNLVFPLVGYSLYAVVGYYIDKYKLSAKTRKTIYVLGTIGLLVHIIGTAALSVNAGELVQTFKGYLNLPCFLYSVAIFTFFKYVKSKKTKHIMDKISHPFTRYTFGVYLVQFFVLSAIYRADWINLYSLPIKIILMPITFLICLSITWIISRIPLLNKTV